jgi:hypothetical protein
MNREEPPGKAAGYQRERWPRPFTLAVTTVAAPVRHAKMHPT